MAIARHSVILGMRLYVHVVIVRHSLILGDALLRAYCHCPAFVHPFTAPKVRPRTICFWNTKKMTIIGIADVVAPAMTSP